MKVGDKVYFGRKNGEQTLGEIVKINQKTAKVKQLEARGTMKDHRIGIVWTVPFSMMTLALAGTTPKVASYLNGRPVGVVRRESEVMRDILACHTSLEPEALTGDGELSAGEVSRRRAELNRRLLALFNEIGRHVPAEEAFAWQLKGTG